MSSINDQASRKLNYHHRSNNNKSLHEKSNPNILTSSPVTEKKDKVKIHEFLMNDKNSDEELIDNNASFKNTIQSINDKDDVNYFVESHNDTHLLKTSVKNQHKKNLQDILNTKDIDAEYLKSSEMLYENIINAIDYFKKAGEISFRNEDKLPVVKILKDDYEKLKNEYELTIQENKKLKEKNKMLKDKSSYQQSSNDSVNVNKFIDSLMFLQSKNEELEKENSYLKKMTDELKSRIRNKNYSEEKYYSKSKINHSQNKSISNTSNNRKNKNDHMEVLIKEQISCMKKMLMLVQEKDNTTTTSVTVN